MATAEVVETTPEMVVSVRNIATVKLEFLRALAKKLIAATAKSYEQVLEFAHRIWSNIPVKRIASTAVGLTATSRGYKQVTSIVRTGLNFITGIFSRAVKLVRKAIYWTGLTIANAVGYVSPPVGGVLRRANEKVNDVSYNLVNWVETTYKGMGNVIRRAYNHPLAVNITTLGSTAIVTSATFNGLLGGLPSRMLSSIPFIGGLMASAITGGYATLFSVIAIASIGATSALIFASDSIIEDIMTEKLEEVFSDATLSAMGYDAALNATGMARIQDGELILVEDKPKRKYTKRQPVEQKAKRPYNRKPVQPVVEEAPVVSDITELVESKALVTVGGNVTEPVAQAIAEQHITDEIASLENQIRQIKSPVKRDYPKKRNKR
jgi:hypothetical protein